MDGHATALACPPVASFPEKPARAENSEERAPGDSTDTAPPPEIFAVDPPSAVIDLPCSGRREADAVVHADPLGSFAERRPGRSVRRRRRRSCSHASSSSAGLTSRRHIPIGDTSTLTRSASFELRRRRYAPFSPPSFSCLIQSVTQKHLRVFKPYRLHVHVLDLVGGLIFSWRFGQLGFTGCPHRLLLGFNTYLIRR
jgi:hypothetical protein